MGKYLKKFNNYKEYTDYKDSNEFKTPNVSHIIETNTVKYNPKLSTFSLYIPYEEGYNLINVSFEIGMTWEEFENSKYNDKLIYSNTLVGYIYDQVNSTAHEIYENKINIYQKSDMVIKPNGIYVVNPYNTIY